MRPADSSPSPVSQTTAPIPPLRYALALWAVLFASSVPAVYLAQTVGGEAGGWPAALWFMAGSQLPWLLATPVLWRLCRRWPLGMGRDLRHGACLLLLGAGVTPLLSAAGWVLGSWLSQLHPWGSLPDRTAAVRAIAATALFAAPTFVAVIGLGQTLAFVQRYRRRGALLDQARQTALRQHLHHHFLFNALNAIGGLGYQRPADADRALAGLSDLLRDAMACPPQRTLAEEVAAANDYLALQRLLRGMPLTVQWRLSAEAWQCQVPSLLLQPLLENAVRHSGWEQAEAALEIDVRADVAEGVLRLSVRNPHGLAPQIPPAGTGSGLGNLRQRLDALHGARGSVQAAVEGDHFSVRLRLPAIDAQEWA